MQKCPPFISSKMLKLIIESFPIKFLASKILYKGMRHLHLSAHSAWINCESV